MKRLLRSMLALVVMASFILSTAGCGGTPAPAAKKDDKDAKKEDITKKDADKKDADKKGP